MSSKAMSTAVAVVTGCVLAAVCTLAQTQPQFGDDPVGWMLQQGAAPDAAPASDSATTQSSTQPSTQPASPLTPARSRSHARVGTLVLSDGRSITAPISTTPGRELRVWVEDDGQYHDIPFSQLKSAIASVVWERQQEEWHFVAAGSDIKEFTGKTYPARMTQYTLTTTDGQTFTGDIVAPLYVEIDGRSELYTLNKRSKGDVGKTLAELVYVKEIWMEVGGR